MEFPALAFWSDTAGRSVMWNGAHQIKIVPDSFRAAELQSRAEESGLTLLLIPMRLAASADGVERKVDRE